MKVIILPDLKPSQAITIDSSTGYDLSTCKLLIHNGLSPKRVEQFPRALAHPNMDALRMDPRASEGYLRRAAVSL